MPERRQWRRSSRSGVFFVNVEHISYIGLVFFVNFEHVIGGWDMPIKGILKRIIKIFFRFHFSDLTKNFWSQLKM